MAYPLTPRPDLGVEGFAGPGGLSQAAEMLELPGRHVGFELGMDACRTARAAGHIRVRADVRILDPARLTHAGTGSWISAPPCPTYGASGKHSGRRDAPIIHAGISALADSMANADHDDEYLQYANAVTDPRTALVLETLRIALRTEGLDWIVAEQVPAVQEIWRHMAAELAAAADWQSCHVITLRADDFGGGSRRTRSFLLAARDYDIDVSGLPHRGHWWCGRFAAPQEEPGNELPPIAQVTMAAALDWPRGVMLRTRGQRKTSGGNLFPADRVAQGLTEKARSWKAEANPAAELARAEVAALEEFLAGRPTHAMTSAEAGVLQGFPSNYPWYGSRTSQFLQVADTVNPLMGAAVLGAATGRPWRSAVLNRIRSIYPPAVLAAINEAELAA
jgi:DNA (cytosine-5)-methyltransferase 1